MFCNRTSVVEEGTKINLVKNLERKIERLTTGEEKEKLLKQTLWVQLEKNGHVIKKKKKERRDEERKKKEKRRL